MKSLLKYTSFAAVGALALGVASAGPASAVDLVVVSWGGAYTASQQKAYHEPYMKLNPDIKILNDDSAAEGLAKLRAQAEAGNVTWDLVDMVASDAIAACDDGLVLEIDPDTDLAPAPDGTPGPRLCAVASCWNAAARFDGGRLTSNRDSIKQLQQRAS